MRKIFNTHSDERSPSEMQDAVARYEADRRAYLHEGIFEHGRAVTGNVVQNTVIELPSQKATEHDGHIAVEHQIEQPAQ